MKEVLKLALEALWTTANPKAEEAITAINAALAQPAQEPDHGDELTIAYMSGVHRGKELAAQPAQEPWCMKMNGCTTKCEDCPDEPAQEPVSVTYKEVADAMNSLWNGTLEQHQIAEQMANKKLYTTPQQRPWMGLTEAQFLEAVRLAENGNYLVAFVRIQEWLKEKNT